MLCIARPLYTHSHRCSSQLETALLHLPLIIQGINAHAFPNSCKCICSCRAFYQAGSSSYLYIRLSPPIEWWPYAAVSYTLRLVLLHLILSVLGLPLLEVGFWTESTLWIVLETALGCADLSGDEWGELGHVSPVFLALCPCSSCAPSLPDLILILRIRIDLR